MSHRCTTCMTTCRKNVLPFFYRTVESNFTCTSAVTFHTARGFYDGNQSFLTLMARISAAAHKTHSQWKKPCFTYAALWLWCHKGHWYVALTKNLLQQEIWTQLFYRTLKRAKYATNFVIFLIIIKAVSSSFKQTKILQICPASQIWHSVKKKKRKTKQKKNAHACSVASVRHCGVDALGYEPCDHCFALRHCRHSRLQAVGQKRRAPGGCPVKRMTPKGSLFIPTIPCGLCIFRYSAVSKGRLDEALCQQSALWLQHSCGYTTWRKTRCSRLIVRFPKNVGYLLNSQLRCSRAGFGRGMLEHTDDRHLQMGSIAPHHLANFQGGRLHQTNSVATERKVTIGCRETHTVISAANL